MWINEVCGRCEDKSQKGEYMLAYLNSGEDVIDMRMGRRDIPFKLQRCQ